MNKEAHVGDKKGQIHTKEHFPEQAHCISRNDQYYFVIAVFAARSFRAGVTKGCFVHLNTCRNRYAVDVPLPKRKTWIKMLACGICNKHKRLRIKLGIFNGKPQFLPVKR